MHQGRQALLEVSRLSVAYRGLPAVRDLDFAIESGSSSALVGANGAGKTTSLLAIAGLLPSNASRTGKVIFRSRRDRAAGHGISYVPAQDKVFTLLTVEENLAVTRRRQRRATLTTHDAYTWFPRLAERRRSLAGNLSGGEQQMLAIAMGLLGSPELVLLDEPTLGLAVPMIESLCATLGQLRKELDITLLLAEADPNWLPRLADTALVMNRGTLVTSIYGDLGESRERIHQLSIGLGVEEALATEASETS